MIQNTPSKAPKKQNLDFNDIINSVQMFFTKMPDNDKIAYGLIVLGALFVIIGLILW